MPVWKDSAVIMGDVTTTLMDKFSSVHVNVMQVSKPTIESKLISLKDFVIRNTTSCLPSTLFACHSDILKLLC